MKISSVELHSGASTPVVLSFKDPGSINPYNVRNILGLDAENIIPRYYGSSPGNSRYYNLSQGSREVSLQISLNPDFSAGQTYSDLRDALYRMISSNRTGKVSLLFADGGSPNAGISGFIEALHFEKDPIVQITIVCDDPMLRGIYPVEIYTGGGAAESYSIFDPISTAPHGLTFEAEIFTADPIDTLVISDPTDPDSWTFSISPAGGFINADILHLSSDYVKELWIMRSGSKIQLADVVLPGSVWPLVFPSNGDNVYAFDHWENVTFETFTYLQAFWGI